MKYVIFSFDDGRRDTYENAVSIMMENNIKATINITTNFIEKPNECNLFPNVPGRSMTIENVLEIYKNGFEIANHGHEHRNTLKDIREANKRLKKWGIPIENIGFASPYSEIVENQSDEFLKEVVYVRSGTQIKRENILYKFIYILTEITKNSYLFYFLNRKNIFNYSKNNKFFKGITITKNTTFNQIKKIIQKMPDDTYIILNFHSILKKEEKGYYDKWVWDIKKFKKLCKFLKEVKEIKFIRTIDLLNLER